MTHITFGTDGIRGKVNEDLTTDTFVRIGQAIGTVFKNAGERRHMIVIAKDPRLSGYTIEYAIAAGIMDVGVDVLLLGPIPTWALSFIVRTTRDDNGVKVFNPDGSKLSKDVRERIERLIAHPDEIRLATKDQFGRPHKDETKRARYIEFAKMTVPNLRLEGLRIVVDCANGAAYKTAPEALYELGAEVIPINNAPDGTNINLNCGSMHLDALKAKVREMRADVGVAFDGDADRVKLVDENGCELNGDHILAIIAMHWLDNGTLSRGDTIVGTSMTNGGLDAFLAECGLSIVRSKVGDHHVLAQMQGGGHTLGGETSGHIIMRLPQPYSTVGDGLIAALQVLQALVRRADKASSLRLFDEIPQVSADVAVKNARIVLEDERVKAAEQSAKQQLGENGRLVLRASGTEPKIRIMIEDKEISLANRLLKSITDAIHAAKE